MKIRRKGVTRINNELISIFCEGSYNIGLQHGKWVIYYKNGKIAIKGNYFNGQKIGCWMYFDEQTNKIKIEYYIR